MKESAQEEGISQNIHFSHHVNSIQWSSVSKTWTVKATTDGAATPNKTLRGRFMFFGTGYYDYKEPLQVDIPGLEDFEGPVVHPQFWPSDLDYADKNIVIVGSGATAITMLPSVTDKAAHVTMLQRSPSYIMSLPAEGTFETVLRKALPRGTANSLIRFKWILTSFIMVSLCRRFPKAARSAFLSIIAKQLPEGVPLSPDFTPRYNPWEQRVCMCPDGDFYKALEGGKASIKTGVIEGVTSSAIRLTTGEELRPDIIVTATGLKINMAGGVDIYVDGEKYDLSKHYVWKMAMAEDLPNVFFAWGYVDASWTLGADATSQLACRLLNRMRKRDVAAVVPRMHPYSRSSIKDLSFLSLQATYVQRGKDSCPKVGDLAPWRPRSYYWKDVLTAWWGDVEDNMEWISW
jgi:cation diffusion facilitator CzcD-associated flavoprotein CzcO